MSSPALQPEMTACFIPFHKTHVMKTGLPSPPASPETFEPPRRTRPKLHLSKFLQRTGRDNSARSSRTSGQDMNEPTPPNTSARRSSKSPFRAVKKMKEPFPLILPDSPTLTDDSEDEERFGELRRIPRCYQDLRTVAEVHFPSEPRKPLLPSPEFLYGEKTEEASSYFAYPDRNLQCNDTAEPEDNYEVHRIISGYCKRERWSLLLEEVRKSRQIPQDALNCSPTRSELSVQESVSSTPPPKWSRPRTCSTESDWLANTLSHEDRVRRFKQRCFQVVQHPAARRGFQVNTNDENQIMLATVVVGPGKPKLIQIQRQSSRSTKRSSVATTTSQSETSLEEQQPAFPKTPAREQRKEVSVFSPYNTPYQGTYRAMTNPLTGVAYSSRRISPRPITTALSLPPRSRIDSAICVDSTNEKYYSDTSSTADPFEDNPVGLSPNTSQYAPDASTTTSSALTPTYQPANSAPRSIRTLNHLLTALTHTIDSFPSHILRLDSPTILLIRRSPSLPTTAYTAPLRSIFPAAAATSPLLLSALAAWLLVDAHLERLVDNEGLSVNGSTSYSANAPLHNIPAKARATLGISDLSAHRAGADNWAALVGRAGVVRLSVKVIAQRLMEAVRGGWDEELWRALRVVVGMVDRGLDREREEWV